jgi:hypothetical protein
MFKIQKRITKSDVLLFNISLISKMQENMKELPKDAIAALEKGNKIEAIKCARAAYDLDLVSAKNMVEMHLAKNPDLNMRYTSESKNHSAGCFPIFVIIGLLALAAGAYYLFFLQSTP